MWMWNMRKRCETRVCRWMGIGTDEHSIRMVMLCTLYLGSEFGGWNEWETSADHQQVENTLAVPSTPYVSIRSSSLCLGLTNLVTPWKGHSEGCTILLSVFPLGFLKTTGPNTIQSWEHLSCENTWSWGWLILGLGGGSLRVRISQALHKRKEVHPSCEARYPAS